jgi:lipopolysaccharide export system permease protein
LRKLEKYLLKDFLLVFSTAMLLITFAFTIGAIYKAIDIMARGLPASVVGRFFIYNIPYSLAYSIPISALFSTLLVFGRLSSDSELNAMKSTGLSLWQIASPVLLVSLLMVGFCFYNNFIIYPSTTYENRQLIKGMGVEDPVKLLEEGRFVRDFPGYMIYIGKKNHNKVRDLVVYEVDKKTGLVTLSVRAKSGILTADKEKGELKIDLFDVRIGIPDPKNPEDASKTRYANAKNYPIHLDIAQMMKGREVSKKRKNMRISELLFHARNAMIVPGMSLRDQALQRSHYLVEIHQRICLALSPFMFVLVAIPLGIRSHRKESSVGMVMSLGIMFIYYVFIILSDTFDSHPEIHPWLIPWIPILFGEILGFFLIHRAN